MGLEDYLGEMDFKVAGTRVGFTGLQLDVKSQRGVPHTVIMEALQKGHDAKHRILNIMNETISEPRASKDSWPVTSKITIPSGKIGRFAGFGGINMKRLTAETGVQLTQDMEDSGTFTVFAPNKDAMFEAEEMMKKFLTDSSVPVEFDFGAIIEVTITEIKDYGVMVSMHPNMDPVLLHLKELDKRKVAHPSALDLEVGQKIQVKYFGRDPVTGFMRISRRVLQMVTPKTVKLAKDENNN
jgi:polyribonucleotide nucleotidyltransferase